MKEIFGIPVHGDVYEERPAIEQRPIEDLEPVFRALIEDPNVHSFGWAQYTPYFNDGDTCEFSVGEPWIRTVLDTDEDASDYDYEISFHPRLSTREYDEEQRKFVAVTSEFPETARLAEKLGDIQRYEFEYAMRQAFGDHARVTVTKDSITIDEYDHG